MSSAAGFVVIGLVVAFAAAMVLVLRRYRGTAVCAPRFALEGRPISGSPLTLLKAIDRAFWEAEKHMGDIPAPAAIDWARFAPETEVLLWEAATHAARVCELNDELAELRPADGALLEAGSAEAVVLHSVERQRTEHLDAMRRIQGEADELARLASNAAAAARVALNASGIGHELDAGLPTGTELAAQSTLADAKNRLAALASAWTSLDASTDIAAERLQADTPAPEPPPTTS